MIALMPDGEDHSFRSKYRLMTVEELVSRAVEVADLAFTTFRERGWILDLPIPDDRDY